MPTNLNDLSRSVTMFPAISAEVVEGNSYTTQECDMSACDGECFAIQVIGSIFGTSVVITSRIEESRDKQNWSTVPGATFTPVNGPPNLQTLSFNRTARYLRYSTSLSGGNPEMQLTVLIGSLKKQY